MLLELAILNHTNFNPQNIFLKPRTNTSIFFLQCENEKFADKLQHAPKNQAEPFGKEINIRHCNDIIII